MIEAAQFMQIYRSREVGQSYITSVGTTLIAMAHALWLTLKIRPQVVLLLFNPRLFSKLLRLYLQLHKICTLFIMLFQIICNGPGTCIPLCASAFLFKVRITQATF